MEKQTSKREAVEYIGHLKQLTPCGAIVGLSYVDKNSPSEQARFQKLVEDHLNGCSICTEIRDLG